MKMMETARIAWEGLSANKMRSFLTTLGIIIGVMAVIIMLAISAGTEAAIAEQINGLGANLILISPMRGIPGAARTLLYEDALAIEETVKSIDGVTAEQTTTPQTVSAGSIVLSEILGLGTTPSYPTVRDMSVAAGRYFDETDVRRENKVVVLGSGIAADLFAEASPVGQTISVGNTRLTVIGVMAPKGIVGDVDYDGRLYLPLSVVYRRYSASPLMEGRVRTIYVAASSSEAIPDTIAQITALLARRHDVDPRQPDFSIQTQQDIIDTQEATTVAFRSLLAWIAAVSLVVGGIGIMNIMLVSVSERTREIGLRAAVGARPVDIRLQFLAEAVVLSLVGGLTGSVLGIAGSYLLGRFGDMPTVLVPLSVPLAFGSAAAVGILFGFVPANKAAQLDPIGALRHE
jgi:putative ABC transport system permease protein